MSRPKLMPEMRAKIPGTGLDKAETKQPTTKPEATPRLVPSSELRKTPVKRQIQGINDVMKLRRSVMDDLRSGKVSDQDIMARIQNAGISDPLAMETVLSDTLNDNVIRYFLMNTKNNTKKARALAKKFGFEV